MTFNEDYRPTTSLGRARRPDRQDFALAGRRFRDPIVHAEVLRRVEIYAEQFARKGRFTWLPHRGTGA